MLAALQLVAVAAVPLNFTVLVPCVAPKFAPTIVTEVPTRPDTGFRLVILGTAVAGFTVSVAAALVTVPAVLLTTTANADPLSAVVVAGVV
jgi:hypothetical protein